MFVFHYHSFPPLDLADPTAYSKVVRKISLPKFDKGAASSHKLMEKKLTVPLIIPSMELPHVEGAGANQQAPGKM